MGSLMCTAIEQRDTIAQLKNVPGSLEPRPSGMETVTSAKCRAGKSMRRRGGRPKSAQSAIHEYRVVKADIPIRLVLLDRNGVVVQALVFRAHVMRFGRRSRPNPSTAARFVLTQHHQGQETVAQLRAADLHISNRQMMCLLIAGPFIDERLDMPRATLTTAASYNADEPVGPANIVMSEFH